MEEKKGRRHIIFHIKNRVIFRVIFCVKQGQKWKKFEKLWKNYKPLNSLKSTEKEKQALNFNACFLAEDTGLEPKNNIVFARVEFGSCDISCDITPIF